VKHFGLWTLADAAAAATVARLLSQRGYSSA